MKLKDILARELKVWPEGVGSIWQSICDNELYFDSDHPPIWTELNEDDSGEHGAKVTRAEWQAAVEALKAEQAAELRPTERAVEWDGASLPPVGIECEIKEEKSWALVKILAHLVDDPRFNPIAIYMEKDNPSALVGQAVASRFRPIRTQEQIAAEEREKVVAEMAEVIHGQPVVGLKDPALYALYAAGYRKQAMVVRELTKEALDERGDYECHVREYGGCSCHIEPTCGACTHPGNPLNQEDDSCWQQVAE